MASYIHIIRCGAQEYRLDSDANIQPGRRLLLLRPRDDRKDPLGLAEWVEYEVVDRVEAFIETSDGRLENGAILKLREPL